MEVPGRLCGLEHDPLANDGLVPVKYKAHKIQRSAHRFPLALIEELADLPVLFQLQSESPPQHLSDLNVGIVQGFLGRCINCHVVHVPHEFVEAEGLGYQLVERLQQVVGQPLRNVEPQRDALFELPEAQPDDVEKPFILDPDCKLPHQNVQPDAVVKMPDVNFQEVPGPFRV